MESEDAKQGAKRKARGGTIWMIWMIWMVWGLSLIWMIWVLELWMGWSG